MARKEKKEFLELFFKCPTCKGLVNYDSSICEYFGNLISYDDETEQYYVSGRVCFKCGFSNKVGSPYCAECGNKFIMICPKCRAEIEVPRARCQKCGLSIDQFYLEKEIGK